MISMVKRSQFYRAPVYHAVMSICTEISKEMFIFNLDHKELRQFWKPKIGLSQIGRCT